MSTTTNYNLTNLNLAAGTYSIQVQSIASGYTDSSLSTAASYIIYSITTTVTGGSYSGALKVSSGSTAVVTISANSGYVLPATVTVTNATSSYNSTTGVISLSAPTGNVTISATCVEMAETPTTSLSEDTLTIESAEEATSFDLYDNGVFVTNIPTTTTGYSVTLDYDAQSNYGGALMLSVNGEAFVTYTSDQTFSFTNVETIEWKTDTGEFVYFSNCTGDFVSGKQSSNTLTLTQDSSATVHTED